MECKRNKISKLVYLLPIMTGLLIINSTRAYAQQDEEPKVKVEGVSYTTADPSISGIHSNFTINYEINSNLFIVIQGYYDTYPGVDIFEVPIMGKKYISNRIFISSGASATFISSGENWAQSDTQFRMIHGVGYDVLPNFFMEVRQNFDFGTSTSKSSQYLNPNAFSLKGKFKF